MRDKACIVLLTQALMIRDLLGLQYLGIDWLIDYLCGVIDLHLQAN